MHRKQPAKFLPLLLAAVVLLGCWPQEVFAHDAWADTGNTSKNYADVYQETNATCQVTLRWHRNYTPSVLGINWCDAHATATDATWEPVTYLGNNYCKQGPRYGSLGVDFETGRKHWGLDWHTIGGLPCDEKYAFAINHYGEIGPGHWDIPHSHTLVLVATIGPNRAPRYGGPHDARRNQSCSFQENPAPNAIVCRPTGTYSEPDGETVYYTLAGTDANKFKIGLTDGAIRSSGTTIYDYDKGQRIFHLTVQAADRMTHSGSTDTRIDDTASVTLSLTNYTGRETPSARQMTAGPANNAIRLSWNKYVQEANKPPFSGYQIRIKQGSRFLAIRGVSNINTTNDTYPGLTNGTTYVIWVEACNHEGCSGNPVGGRVNVTPAAAGVAVTRASPFRVNEGSSNFYTLVLRNRPADPVVIAVSRKSGSTVLTAAPPRLTFTPLNWYTPQKVTLSAANDRNTADESAIFSHKISGDSEYTALSIGDFTALATEDDVIFRLAGLPRQTYQVGVAINPLTLPPADAGGSSLSYTLTPALPGLSLTGRVLRGIPAAGSAPADYTYTAINSSGGSDSLIFTIAVLEDVRLRLRVFLEGPLR